MVATTPRRTTVCISIAHAFLCLAVTACGSSDRPRLLTDPADTGVTNDGDAGRELIFRNATAGRSCLNGANDRYLVLSEDAADCRVHAEAASGTRSSSDTLLYITVPQTAGEMMVDATLCRSEEDCRTVSLNLTVDAWTVGDGATGRYAFTLDGVDVSGEFTASWCTYDQFLPGPRPLAADIAAQGLSVMQGTSVTVARTGTITADRRVPVVELRPAIIRAHASPKSGYSVREIVASLTLQRPGHPPDVFEQTRRITRPSADSLFETTFNFDIDGALITTDVEWKVSLHEADRCVESDADTADALLPRGGTTAEMNAQSMGGSFDIVLVPFRYNFDGSGRLPDTSPAQLERFRNELYARFPISELNITVREPADYDDPVLPIRTGWGALVEALWALRASDEAPETTYYYGLITPRDTEEEFCTPVCIAGNAGVIPDPSDTYSRGAVGLGFSGDTAARFFVHEVGHSVGRFHAPCSGIPDVIIAGVDPDYPYDNASIGALGYNIVTKTFLGIGRNRDFMSYCEPNWVSDYTYVAIFERLRQVNSVAAFAPWPTRFVRAAIVGNDSVSWGHRAELHSPVMNPVSVWFEDDNGHVVATKTADRIKLSHGTERILWIPDVVPRGATRVRLPDGRTLPL